MYLLVGLFAFLSATSDQFSVFSNQETNNNSNNNNLILCMPTTCGIFRALTQHHIEIPKLK